MLLSFTAAAAWRSQCDRATQMRCHRNRQHRLLPAKITRANDWREVYLVTGYQGGADIELAVEGGEVHCRAFTVQVFFGREPFHIWRSKNIVRVLVRTGKKRDPRSRLRPPPPGLGSALLALKISDSQKSNTSVSPDVMEFTRGEWRALKGFRMNECLAEGFV